MPPSQPSFIKNAKPTPLNKLFKRLFYSFILALVGSWGLIIPRLNFVKIERELLTSNFFLYVDAVSLGLALLGVFLIIYYKHVLTPRLERLDGLGEAGW